MSQLQVTGEAKIRTLTGALTATAGVVTSVPLGAANGVATLGGDGKVPSAQLPTMASSYKGTWNAATNTPTIADGVGTAGDYYLVSTGGTWNGIVFLEGNTVIYSGTVWQKAGGGSGTVTSVGLAAPAAFSVSGSPVTSTGTLTLIAAGTISQYINGAGSLTTFPDLSVYVDLSTNQTIGGTKTFSSAIKADSGIRLKDGVATGGIGYVGIGSNAGQGLTLGIYNSGTVYYQDLFFPITNGYQYTFPASDGTIALTSNLSSYLPLAGGTLTGPLNGTSASFSSSVTAATDLISSNGTLYISAGSGLQYTSRLSTVYNFPYVDTYLDSFAGASYEGRLNFRTNSAGGAMSTKMTILNNGNVGINTDTPEALLHINKAASGGEGSFIFLDNSAGSALGNKSGIRFACDTGATFSNYNAYIEAINVNAGNGAASLTFGTWNGASRGERMRIASDGSVGFSTNTIGSKVQINGNLAVGYSASMAAPTFGLQVSGEIISEAGISVSNVEGGVASNYYGTFSGGSTPLSFLYGSSGTVTWNNGGAKMVLSSSGNLQVVGLSGTGSRTVTADASGNLSASSDSSLKQEDKTHQIEGLTEILKLQPRAYKWLSDIEIRGEEAVTEIGFFADEVNTIIPSAAPKGTDNLYGFYDRAVIAALVKGMQEQQKQIQELKEIMVNLKLTNN